MILPRRRRLADRERDDDRPGPDPPIAALVDEGMLIAGAALRLAAKNALILRAVRDGARYDRDALAAVLRAEMADLAAEKRADAERLRATAARAARRRGRAVHQTDYRRSDVRPLTLRERVGRGIAERLERLTGDDDYIDGILDAARDAALAEILGAGIVTATDAFRPDPAYPAERADRMRLVRDDLSALERSPARRSSRAPRRSRTPR